jgi:hypothetical protein
MAKQVLGPLTQITVNGVDLSSWCTSVTVEDSKDEVDVTGFGETYREFLPGLGDSSITATFLQDTASGAVDATIYPLYSGNTAGTVKVKPNTSGTVVYTQISKVFSYPPVSGGVGDANTIDITFRNAGTAGLTRGTS